MPPDEQQQDLTQSPVDNESAANDSAAIAFDATANKEIELALREAKEYAESIVDTIPNALLVLETDLRVRTANNTFYEMFAVQPEETEGELIYALGNGQWDIPELRTLFEDILPENNSIVGYEVDHEFEEIGRRIMLLNGRRLNHLRLILLTITDITERKQSEEALRESEERLQQAIAIDTVGVLFFTLDGHTTDANEALERMTGYSRDELLTTVNWEVLTPPEYMDLTARAAEELATCGETAPYEKEFIRKDGSRWWGLCAPRRLTGSGPNSKCVEFIIDITERKRAAAALRQVNEQLEGQVEERTAQVRNLVTQLTMSEQAERRRISQILHDDLQQRLYGVRFQLASLRNALSDDHRERALATIDTMEEILQTAVQTTRSLSVDLSPPILFNEGLAEAVRWLATQMERQHGLSVTVQATDDVPVPGDDLQVLLFQTVRELLFNVVKHAEVLEASVSLSRIDHYIHIEIIDTGKGFDVDLVLSSLIQSFGLDKIQRRLELMGGHLQIESIPGEGTRIVIECPTQYEAG